jgi:hypothetical protein
MRPILLAHLLLAVVAVPVAAQGAPAAAVPPTLPHLTDSTARQGSGARAVVTGPVVQVKSHTHDGTAYLNFGGRFPAHTFSVIIPDSAVARFGDLTRYEGHRARVTGTIWIQDGKWPAMTVTDPAALELLP